MKSLFPYIAFTLLLLFVNSCTDEIDLDTEFDSKLLVFGVLTNDTDFVTITIHKTVSVKNKGTDPVPNAEVSLFTKNQNGNTSLVTNDFTISNGNYQSTEMITPEIGSSYWIEIKLPNGNTYLSKPETLKKPIPINQIIINKTIPRVQFIDPKNDRNFYQLQISFFYDQDLIYEDFELSTDVLFNGNDDAFIELSNSLIGTNLRATLSNLNFDTYRFYSKIVKQDEELNNFATEGPGQLFTSPAANLTGNITNTITNEKELGNFSVISTSNIDFSF